MKVVIPTAGCGSRLGKLTKYTNKALLRVGNKAVISHIIESYPKDTTFIILVGYKKDLVKEYLSFAHPTLDFVFLNVFDIKSLGFSLLRAKNHLQEPFIFHACDTILTKVKTEVETTWMTLSESTDDCYRLVTYYNDEVQAIHDKGRISKEDYDQYHYVGVAGIYHYELFWKYLEGLNTDDESVSDVDVFNCFLEANTEPIRGHFIESDCWYDTGNLEGLERARNAFKTGYNVLYKTDEDIFINNGLVVKFFADKEKCVDRLNRYDFSLAKLTPEILFRSSNFFSYKKIEGKTLAKTITPERTIHFLNWANSNLWEFQKNTYDTDFPAKCKEFYFEKTLQRARLFYEKFDLQDQKEVINNESLPTTYNVILSLAKITFLFSGIRCKFHGDLVVENILDVEDDFVLIDWRQDFAGDKVWGDIYYDLAKFAHSLIIRHDVLINKNFFIEEIRDGELLQYRIDFLESRMYRDCLNVFYAWCKKHNFSLDKIKCLVGIIWMNMAPLHEREMGIFLMKMGKLMTFKYLSILQKDN